MTGPVGFLRRATEHCAILIDEVWLAERRAISSQSGALESPAKFCRINKAVCAVRKWGFGRDFNG